MIQIKYECAHTSNNKIKLEYVCNDLWFYITKDAFPLSGMLLKKLCICIVVYYRMCFDYEPIKEVFYIFLMLQVLLHDILSTILLWVALTMANLLPANFLFYVCMHAY